MITCPPIAGHRRGLYLAAFLFFGRQHAARMCGRGEVFDEAGASRSSGWFHGLRLPVWLPLSAYPALAAPADGTAVLAPHRAVYDLKLLEIARHPRRRGGARPHCVRLFRQRLRGLRSAIPPGVRTRLRRGQGGRQRNELDDLGRRQCPQVSVQFAEQAQRQAHRRGRWPRRTHRQGSRDQPEQAEAAQADGTGQRGVSDRAYAPHPRRRARRPDDPGVSGL